MKKNYLVVKIVFGLCAGIFATSCISDTESPILTEQLEKSVALSEGTSGEENLRKSREYNYLEKFSNEIGFIPDVANGWVANAPAPAWYPGTGVGNATFMGKAYSFINQYASFSPYGLSTVGAPVTQFYSNELSDLGLVNIPDEVSSLTTDGKGNSVWYKNILNRTTPSSSTRTDFTADVEIVGGTGKFEGATGNGTVEGFFNPQDGKGSTTLRASIVY